MAVNKLIVGKKYRLDYEGWVKDFYKKDPNFRYSTHKIYDINSIGNDDEVLKNSNIITCSYINQRNNGIDQYPMYFKEMKFKNNSLSSIEGNDCWWMFFSILKFMTPVNEIEDYEV